jgi:lysozyme
MMPTDPPLRPPPAQVDAAALGRRAIPADPLENVAGLREMPSAVDLALEMVQRHEGFRAAPYRDAVGVPTIGYGHTDGVTMDMAPWTEAQAADSARARIVSDSARFARNGWPIDPALFSAAYNLGVGGLKKTGAIREASTGNWEAAADSLVSADRAGGRRLEGLSARRQEEADRLRANARR